MVDSPSVADSARAELAAESQPTISDPRTSWHGGLRHEVRVPTSVSHPLAAQVCVARGLRHEVRVSTSVSPPLAAQAVSAPTLAPSSAATHPSPGMRKSLSFFCICA